MVPASPVCKVCEKVEDASLHMSGHVENCPDEYHTHHAYVPPEQAEFVAFTRGDGVTITDFEVIEDDIMDRFDDVETEIRREGGR